MPKLTDTQAILLSAASQRADGGLLPAPDTLNRRSRPDRRLGRRADQAWSRQRDRGAGRR